MHSYYLWIHCVHQQSFHCQTWELSHCSYYFWFKIGIQISYWGIISKPNLSEFNECNNSNFMKSDDLETGFHEKWQSRIRVSQSDYIKPRVYTYDSPGLEFFKVIILNPNFSRNNKTEPKVHEVWRSRTRIHSSDNLECQAIPNSEVMKCVSLDLEFQEER